MDHYNSSMQVAPSMIIRTPARPWSVMPSMVDRGANNFDDRGGQLMRSGITPRLPAESTETELGHGPRSCW
jgi:hypothetical protein